MDKRERKAYSAKYYAEHREERKAYNAKHYAEHREEHKAADAKYRAEHRDEIKASRSKYRSEHRDEIKAYCAEHREEARACAKAYAATPKGKLANKRKSAKRRLLHPEKIKAKNAVQIAVRCGRLVRPSSCEICGVECIPHGHHWSYEKENWLDVRFVCARCHSDIHHKKTGLGRLLIHPLE